MKRALLDRRHFLGGLIGAGTMVAAGIAQERPRTGLQEPVFRVAANNGPEASHPLDKAEEVGNVALDFLRKDVTDYTATLVKQERIKGVLSDEQQIFARIRNRKIKDDKITTKFAVYLYFMRPEALKGQEVLYVEGENNGKFIGKKGGIGGRLLPSMWLAPDSAMALESNLHPITEIGIENLVVKLLARVKREKARGGDCEVQFVQGVKLNKRPCTIMNFKHPVKRPEIDYHLAQVFIDDEYRIPVRFAAYGWPEKEGATAPLLEAYTYLNLKLNAGSQDSDFDHKNPNYKF